MPAAFSSRRRPCSSDGLSRRQEDPRSPACCRTARSRTASRARASARARRSRSPTSTTTCKDRVVKIAAEFGTVPGAAVRRDAATTRSTRCSTRCGASGAGSTAWCTRSRSRRARRSPATSSNGLSREAFAIAHDVSSYSLAALAKGARPLMQGRDGALRHAHLPRRGARAAELQRDGPRQGEPRGERALPRRLPRPRGHPRQRDLGRADQDARRRRHRRLLARSCASSRRPRRCAATSRSTKSATSPRSCCSDLASGDHRRDHVRRRRILRAVAGERRRSAPA